MPNFRPILPCIFQQTPGNCNFDLFHYAQVRKINRQGPKCPGTPNLTCCTMFFFCLWPWNLTDYFEKYVVLYHFWVKTLRYCPQKCDSHGVCIELLDAAKTLKLSLNLHEITDWNVHIHWINVWNMKFTGQQRFHGYICACIRTEFAHSAVPFYPLGCRDRIIPV